MADSNQQSIWLDLESRFRQIRDPYIRADWNRNKTDSGVCENWSVTGTSNILGIRWFEELASFAGKSLWQGSGKSLVGQPNFLFLWLNYIKSDGFNFTCRPPGWGRNDDGKIVEWITMGTIGSVVEVSATLCLRLATDAPPASEHQQVPAIQQSRAPKPAGVTSPDVPHSSDDRDERDGTVRKQESSSSTVPQGSDNRNALDSVIFDLSEKDLAPETMCETLDFKGYETPQNRRCKWRHSSWSDAYRTPRFQNSVRKYISTALRRERERRQTG